MLVKPFYFLIKQDGWAIFCKLLLMRIVPLTTIMAGIMFVATPPLGAQEENDWSAHKTIPGFHPETEPPVLMVDQSGTVHALSSQFLGEDENQSLKAVMYNQWSLDTGWTMPVDILLSPEKDEARLVDAYLDESGMMHLIFYGGEDGNARIFYSKAPAADAGQASAWSEPVVIGPRANDPADGVVAGDGDGNLVVLYAGQKFGVGWYQTRSLDNGNTWSKETLFFPTYNENYSPFYINTFLGDSGLLHAVWSVNNRDNHGLAIYYANYDFDSMRWSIPLELAKQHQTGTLGTQAPKMIEYHGTLFVMYYDNRTRRQQLIQSSDGGQTWSEPVVPFAHEGLNGPGSFVVDSNDILHYFWAQRLRLSTDFINGLWHVTWQESEWSDFEAVVTGKKVIDLVGFNAFDPNTPHAAISRGNAVLVTWRSDRGSRGNGVWYSTAVLDAPQLAATPLPTIAAVPMAENDSDNIVEISEPAREAIPDFGQQVDLPSVAEGNPSEDLFASLVPVTLLVLIIVIYRRLSQSHPRRER